VRVSKPPADAMDLLWQRLGARHEDASFARVDDEMRATWGDDPPVSMGQDERAEYAERGRLAVLEIVLEVCARAPDLKADWYAVSTQR
jgi:hypothetical protein